MAHVGVLVHEGKSLGKGPEEMRRRLGDAGYADSPWAVVSKSKKAPAQVRQLLADGVDRLLVWGGDGTVRRCIDTVVAEDAKIEVAILPAGTANHLASAVGVPDDLPGALDVALTGIPRLIDVGTVNGQVFAVMAGTGFDALMIRDADDKAKARFGRLSYIRAGARHLNRTGTEMKVSVDGRTWFRGRASCILIGNVGQIIGGIDVFPEARLDDGLLEVGVLTAEHRRDWARVGARAVFGRIDKSAFVQMTAGTTVKVKLDHKLPWELDGGDQPPAKRLDVSVLPARIPILVPAS
jgi:YegS/Rv2252/BmrU family lipid kinase